MSTLTSCQKKSSKVLVPIFHSHIYKDTTRDAIGRSILFNHQVSSIDKTTPYWPLAPTYRWRVGQVTNLFPVNLADRCGIPLRRQSYFHVLRHMFCLRKFLLHVGHDILVLRTVYYTKIAHQHVSIQISNKHRLRHMHRHMFFHFTKYITVGGFPINILKVVLV